MCDVVIFMVTLSFYFHRLMISALEASAMMRCINLRFTLHYIMLPFMANVAIDGVPIKCSQGTFVGHIVMN